MLENLTIPDLVITADHPAIPGHFPNSPIIPAALILDEIAKQVYRQTGHSVSGFSHTRFVRPALPDQPMSLQTQSVSTTQQRFQLSAGDEVLCKGRLSTSIDTLMPMPMPMPSADKQSRMDATALYQYLPHAGDMCLLDSIINWTDDTIYCQARRHSAPFGDPQKAPIWSGLEYAAQAAACHSLLSKPGNHNKLAKAFVINVKNINVLGKPLTANGTTTVATRLLANLSEAASYQFTLYHNETATSTGQFNVTVG